MFNKILFPTDFSDVSTKALGYIKKLREGGAETVILVHVIDQRIYLSSNEYGMAGSLTLEKEIIALAEKGLQEIEEDLMKSGFKVKTRLQTGFPTREILRAEKEEDVSVIVIGSHGKSNLEEMFLGSVSEKVIRKCKKPVFVIKR